MKKISQPFFNQPTLKVAKDLIGKFIVRRHRGKEIAGIIIETEAYIGPRDRASHAYLPRQNFGKSPLRRLQEIFKDIQIKDKKTFYKNFVRGNGKLTKHNRAEYLDGGHIYIYLVYGMHWQLNISTAGEGRPECVLIRAVKSFSNSPHSRTPKHNKLATGQASSLRGRRELENNKKTVNGPGKVCRYFKLNKSFYAEDVCGSKRIWLEDRDLEIQSEKIKRGPRIGIDYAGKYWAKKPWRFWLSDKDSRR